MKIAIFSSSFFPEVNGVSVALMERIKCLADTEHQTIVFCPDYQLISSVYPNWSDYVGKIYPNVEIIGLPCKPFLGLKEHPTYAFKALLKIKNTLCAFQPDIIHADDIERMYFGILYNDYPIKYAKKHHIPCVAMYHTNFLQYIEDYALTIPFLRIPFIYNFLRYLFIRSYSKYNLVLVSSKIISRYLQSMGMKKIYYDDFLGVDVDLFNPLKKTPRLFAEKYGFKEVEGQLKIVNVGRLSVDKGWSFLLSSIPELSKEINHKDIVFFIVGYGDLEEEIQKKIEPFFKVFFLGKLSHKEVSEIYASCDLFFTASEKESKGLTVLEAAASGLPVIAPRAGGVIESVIEEETGCLYDPGNRKDFIDKFVSLVKNRERLQKMGYAGRLFAEKFSWKSGFEKWILVLKNICSKK